MNRTLPGKGPVRLLYPAKIATSHLKNASKRNRKSKPESQKTKVLIQPSSEKQDPPHPCEPIEVELSPLKSKS
jgi:hypothetical protein